jgi:hypothetical protein
MGVSARDEAVTETKRKHIGKLEGTIAVIAGDTNTPSRVEPTRRTRQLGHGALYLSCRAMVCVYIDDRLIRGMQSDCAPAVHESNVFVLLGIALSEKQIPRFVGNVSS